MLAARDRSVDRAVVDDAGVKVAALPGRKGDGEVARRHEPDAGGAAQLNARLPDLLALASERPWPIERPPYALETSVPGVFAAGDVRLDSMKRVASAVGEDAMSIYLVHRYLATI